MDAKLDQIIQKLDSLDNKYETLVKSNNDTQHLLTEMKNENVSLKKEIYMLQQKIDILENHSRRNNLVFYGIEESEAETWSDCEKKIVSILKTYLHLEISLDCFERAHRLGEKKSKGSRPIIGKFVTFKTKDLILSHASKFKNTQFSVSEDFSRRVQEIRNQLKPWLITVKKNGAHAFLRYDKLVVNKQTFKLEDVQNCLAVCNQNDPAHSKEESSDKRITRNKSSNRNHK